MKKIVSVAVSLGLLGTVANAQIVLQDNFDRPDGDLSGTVPTPGPGGAWTAFSGIASNPLQILGGQAVVAHGAGSREDAGSSFALAGSGVLTAVFDINVSAASPITGGDYEYFAMFTDGGTSNFKSRLDVVEANVGGNDFTLGLATGGSTAETIFPTDFSFGQTLTVSLVFDFDTGLSSLTVGATTIQSTGVYLGQALNTFALRQSTSSLNETILVDNLVVTHVPEPTTLALGGVGLFTLLLVRRRS